MSDPLSVAASVAGLISLGITVSQSLVDFYNSYKDLDSDLNSTVKRLESLLKIFTYLGETVSNRKFQADERDLVKTIEESISECDNLIHELQDEYEKLRKTSSGGVKAAIKLAGRRATYPFRKSTLEKIVEDIDEIHANLSSALGVLQLKDNKRIQTEVADVKTLLCLVKSSQESSELHAWLKAPDATVDHNAACLKRHPETGLWLTEDPRFSEWLIEGNSILWVNGFAGSGKSVLCSTAIQSVLSHRKSDTRIGIAFFYFTFNNESKQDDSAMLRALVLQLSNQLQDGHADLVRLHNAHEPGTPPSPDLLECLRSLVEKFEQVYIMLDALDESPQNGPRGYVLAALETMRGWALQGLHLFVTSRDERDIHESLDLSTTQKVAMQNAGVDQDIVNFIAGRLKADRSLQKWKKHRDKIQDTLARRAKGVFRWVECQFKSLQSCPCNQYRLERLLNSLPQSLDETYERMLCNINQDSIEDARRMLTLLCFASRPLSVPELIDGTAVETTEPARLNKDRRFQDYNDINEICPGFTSLNVAADNKLPTVQIAHFSVQEYLESDRIRHGKATIFALTSVIAHEEITQICLIYLLEPNLSSPELGPDIQEEYPLAKFAAKCWYDHYKSTATPAPRSDTLISRLFQHEESFKAWIELHDMDDPKEKYGDEFRTTSPVYYASLLGLEQTLYELLNTKHQEGIDARGGAFGSALKAASFKGHEKVVQQLLEKGADANDQAGMIDWYMRRIEQDRFGNALQAASYNGHENVVQQLLDKGADITAQGGGVYGSALQAASHQGHEEMVQLLLDKGANVNAQYGEYASALQAASRQGYEKVVQLLIDKGADINAQFGEYGTALQAVSWLGRKDMVQLLLDNGADVNAQGGTHGSALQAASRQGHEKMVQLLLDKGANVNARGGIFGTALLSASHQGHEKVVQLLLDKGADINAQFGRFNTALQAASFRGKMEVVQLLLDKGADTNVKGGRYGSALQAASWLGRKDMVQLLLDNGADVNVKGGRYGNALNAASSRGKEKVVRLLLDNGADVNAQGGEYGNALEAALESTRFNKAEVVQLLLANGAIPEKEDKVQNEDGFKQQPAAIL